VESKHRIAVGAKVLGRSGSADDAIEYSAGRRTIKRPTMGSKANNSTVELIHNNHHPVRLEDQRFTSKKIHTL